MSKDFIVIIQKTIFNILCSFFDKTEDNIKKLHIMICPSGKILVCYWRYFGIVYASMAMCIRTSWNAFLKITDLGLISGLTELESWDCVRKITFFTNFPSVSYAC